MALTPEAAKAIAVGENDDRLSALAKAIAEPSDGLVRLIDALLDDAVKIAEGRVYIVRDGKALDAATGAETTLPPNAEDVVNNNRVRGELDTARAAFSL
ncbi:MAG: urea ABC transporter permease subunit UrtB, partial [Betaproteobacteria bacterium]